MTDPLVVSLTPTADGTGLELPAYATIDSAGVDLRAAIHDPQVIAPAAWALIPAGFRMALPQGFEAQIRPRSGLALRYGVTCLNSPGTIDADYRGEVAVLLINHGAAPFTVTRGMRIAQMVVAPVARLVWEIAAELPSSDRGSGGFGSTGIDGNQP